ncbi:MAG: endolytic transglycosylase MltG [Pseudomonadota bacterium]
MRRTLWFSMLVLTLAWLALDRVQRVWEAPLAVPAEGYELLIERGTTLGAVLKDLHEADIVAYPRLVALYGRYTGLDQRMRRGEYRLLPGLDAAGLLDLLSSGRVISYQVTLPEGLTLAQALEVLQETPRLESTLSGQTDLRVMELIAPRLAPEGLFFPDSYRFERGDTDLDILRRAHSRMQAVLQQEWMSRAPDLPFDTPYEALVLASIVERETGVASERGEIAGVFARRLRKGMRLQTDPTVIYGLGAEFDGNLKRKHLRDASNPFNTYRHHGLPPTPIALPGQAAINAALNPLAGDTLFFVARGDGSHVFSETLEEHERAVRKYQLNRRKDYRSSPGSKQ